ncbi:F-box protein CPR1-like [Arachis stenosperma]|uniref:F-box protein CPR1-like n=1 Tax=Arachis stenosperma TaxID=217475 RepID=UPI0025AD02AA|nr:F-box protein CPR1-like [Arachis stenosperma]
MERKQLGMNDILPRELICRIFLRVPAKDLFCLRFVSKLWHSFISDPDFAESHYNLHSASSRSYLLVKDYSSAYCVHLDTLFDVAAPAPPPTLKEVSLPSRKEPYPHFRLLGSCRGFVLLKEKPDFLVICNPATGSSKTISYSHIKVRRDDSIRYGFGFDASRDDYLIVLSWHKYPHGLVCFSLRTNSWINLDEELPKTRVRWKQKLSTLFLHGAIHWLCYSNRDHIDDDILILDLKERSFSTISMPTQLVGCYPIYLITLGGYLGLALYSHDKQKTEIWVMKEYKVPSSWILMYEIPCGNNLPLCMSNGNDIIALNFTPLDYKLRFVKYNGVSFHSPVTLRIGIRRRKLAKNVLNNMMLPKIRMTMGSNKGREYGANILVNNEHTAEQLKSLEHSERRFGADAVALAEEIWKASERESLEASIEAAFEAIRSCGTDSHVVPSHSVIISS